MLLALIRNYPQIHIGIGIAGNLMFVVGSVLFFKAFEDWYNLAVWLFVLGSASMLIGSIGDGVIRIVERYEAKQAKAALR